MARITRLRIANYRSVADTVEIRFPRDCPVVLFGENNTGKSNIVRALQLVLGPFWPGNYEPEDHEFHGRRRERAIDIRVEFDQASPYGGRYYEVYWRYEQGQNPSVTYRAKPGRTTREDGWVSNDDRDTCMCVAIEADRNLQYHLGYSSKWTFLSRLMHRFHKVLISHPDTKGDLENLFEQTKAKFKEITEFNQFVDTLRAQLGEFVASMTHHLEVDFEAYNPVNFFHALRLQAAEAGQPRSIDEMGTGEQQILALVFAHAYAKAFHGGVFLVVEEPEAHLHPLAQDWLAHRFGAMARDGLQIVVTTHSPSFINIEHLEGLVLVRKTGGATRVEQIDRKDLVRYCISTGVPSSGVTEANILPFYSASATREIMEGFFAKVVVLVEGPTEALALPIYLERSNLETAREGVAIIPVYGKGSLARWRRLFTAYGIPTYLIFDNDPEDDAASTKRKDALRAVGLEDGQHGALIDSTDWVIQPEFAIFGSNFEAILRENFEGYHALEEAVRMEGVDRKPFIAREVASRLSRREEVGWQKFDELAGFLKMKLGTGHAPPVETDAEVAAEKDVPF